MSSEARKMAEGLAGAILEHCRKLPPEDGAAAGSRRLLPDGDCVSTDPRCMHQPQAEGDLRERLRQALVGAWRNAPEDSDMAHLESGSVVDAIMPLITAHVAAESAKAQATCPIVQSRMEAARPRRWTVRCWLFPTVRLWA